MKQNGKTLLLGIVCSMMVCACGENKMDQVKEFGDKVAKFAGANRLDSLRAVYPGAAGADSVALSLYPDSVKVQKTDKENIFKVTYNSKQSMFVIISGEKSEKMSVMESTGLFAYPQKKLDFARKTGLIEKGMNDIKIAERMKNFDALKAFLYTEYAKSRTGGLKVGKFVVTKEPQFGIGEGRGYYPVINVTGEDIKPGEYTLNWKIWEYWAGMPNEKISRKSETGKQPIPAGGTVNIPVVYSFHQNSELLSVTLKTKSIEEFESTYQPKGDEYSRFTKNNTKTTE